MFGKNKNTKKSSSKPKSNEVVEEKSNQSLDFKCKEFVSFKRNGNVFSDKVQISAITNEGFFILPHVLGKKLHENKIKMYGLDKNQTYILATKNELTKI